MVRIPPGTPQCCSSGRLLTIVVAVLVLLPLAAGLPTSVLAQDSENRASGEALGPSGAAVFTVFGENGYGTAFLCNSAGLFLTEQRIVTGSIPPRIVISPNQVLRARVVAESPDRGIAVLWVNPAHIAGMKVLPIAQSDPEVVLVAAGDSTGTVRARVRTVPEFRWGSVRRVGEHQFETDLPPQPGDAGGPVLNAKGEVIGMLLPGSKGSPPGTLAVLIGEALPLLDAAIDSIRALPKPSAEILPPIPSDPYPTSDLRTLGERPDLTEYQIATAGYLVSILTPPVCYALEAQQPRDADRWLLWGAFEGEHRSVVAIHIQTTKHLPSILWPLGAIVKIGKGTARVFASIAGTIEDGVTGGGSESSAPRVKKRDHCEVQLLRNGIPVEPVLCQCSGHTYDSKRATFIPHKGSTAAFFYFGWRTFEPAGAHPPDIVLELFDPSRPDETETIPLPRKILEMIAVDLEPVLRGEQDSEPRVVAAGATASPNAHAAASPAVFLVKLRGGSVLRAVEVKPRGARDLGIVLEAGGRISIAGDEVSSILDELGNDWTRRVVIERSGVPEER